MLAAGQRLGGVARTDQDQHRDREDGDQDGQQQIAQLSPQLHDAGRRRNEQQREDAGEEHPGFLDLLQLDDAQPEGRQKQDQAIDAGRDGQRKNGVTDLAEKTKRKDARKLKQILRNKTSFVAAKSKV